MYECINGPTSPWCSILAYKPGEASQFWKAAWKEIEVINGVESSADKEDEVINGVESSADKEDEVINGVES